MKRIGRTRRKSRHKLSKSVRERGKISVNRMMQSFEAGSKVRVKLNGSYQKTSVHARFHGKIGIVKAKKGKVYEVSIKDGGKEKTLLLHPIHLIKG
ncbi:50S ribosomal protein L21e [Candidatus Woesearchaeota archaeon]|nr:MAG: 50S ribosomal protein L21e [Candidatus Woesearchaeota archaeon]